MKRLFMLFVVGVSLMSAVGCSAVAPEGTVAVQTVRGQISKVYYPKDGWAFTETTFVLDSEIYPVDVKNINTEVGVRGTTVDNAAFSGSVFLGYQLSSAESDVKGLVQFLGLDGDVRQANLTSKITQIVTDEFTRVISDKNKTYEVKVMQDGVEVVKKEPMFDAYGINLNKDTLATELRKALSERFKTDLFNAKITSVAIRGNFDFVNDDIDKYGSQVAANQKKEQAAQYELNAEKIAAQTKQLQATVYEKNPGMLKLEMLKNQTESMSALATGIAQHKGTLILNFGSGGSSNTMLNLGYDK